MKCIILDLAVWTADTDIDEWILPVLIKVSVLSPKWSISLNAAGYVNSIRCLSKSETSFEATYTDVAM
jgi:hypothetical protein